MIRNKVRITESEFGYVDNRLDVFIKHIQLYLNMGIPNVIQPLKYYGWKVEMEGIRQEIDEDYETGYFSDPPNLSVLASFLNRVNEYYEEYDPDFPPDFNINTQ